MWLEPDLNMPDGESLVRQLLVGNHFPEAVWQDSEDRLEPRFLRLQLAAPQIYKRSGIDYFVTQKMAWNDTNNLPFKIFWWESPDGSKVLTYFPHDYANGNLDPSSLIEGHEHGTQFSPGMPD